MIKGYGQFLLDISRQEGRVIPTIEKMNLVNTVDTWQATMLHHASFLGNEQVVRYLLSRGSNVNAKDCTGRTPLMLAVDADHISIVRLLLSAGADIDILDKNGTSALRIAFAQHPMIFVNLQQLVDELLKKSKSHEDIAETIIRDGGELYQAVFTKNHRVVEYLLQRGYPVDSRHPYSKQTALHLAVTFDELEIVRVLLKYNADASARDLNGAIPLHYVYEYATDRTADKTEIVRLLADVSPLMSCVYMTHLQRGVFQVSSLMGNGCSAVIRMLLRNNLSFNATDGYKRNLWHYVAGNVNLESINELKAYANEVDVNARDKHGESPLYWAVKRQNRNAVVFLLEQGADPNVASHLNDATPVCLAHDYVERNYYNERMAELLFDYDADPQVVFTDANGERVTIFDAALKYRDFWRMRSAIAQLALREKSGVPINNVIRRKIALYSYYNYYLNRCRRQLNKFISGTTVTVYRLLTANDRQWARYLNNKDIVVKLKRLNVNKVHLKYEFPYYYRSLRRRHSAGLVYKRLRELAADPLCTMLDQRFDKRDLVIDKVMDFLSHNSLQHLSKL